MNSLFQLCISEAGATISDIDTDLTADSDIKLTTQKGIKTAVDAKEATVVTQSTPSLFGAWTKQDSASGTLAKSVVYTATGDGFICAYTTTDTGVRIETPNGTLRMGGNIGTDWATSGQAMCPVRKDDTVEVLCSATTVVSWLPFGTGELTPP